MKYEKPTIEQDVEIVGERGSFSEVIYNHKAFFRNTESKLYGFPVSLYGANDVFKGQGLP